MRYENPIPITPALTHRRIYSPLAYPLVRTTQVVDVVISEALRLAALFPVAWQRRGGAIDLVAGRSPLGGGPGLAPVIGPHGVVRGEC